MIGPKDLHNQTEATIGMMAAALEQRIDAALRDVEDFDGKSLTLHFPGPKPSAPVMRVLVKIYTRGAPTWSEMSFMDTSDQRDQTDSYSITLRA